MINCLIYIWRFSEMGWENVMSKCLMVMLGMCTVIFHNYFTLRIRISLSFSLSCAHILVLN